MKKIFFLFSLVVSLSACVQEENVNTESKEKESYITFLSKNAGFTNTKVNTRASQMLQNTIQSFGVSSSYYPNNETYTTAGCGSYFFNINIDAKDGWSGYYWPGLTYNLSFFAYTPNNDPNIQIVSTPEELGIPTYHCETSSSTDEQKDFMTCNILDHEGLSRTPVSLTFNHKYSDVRFFCYNQSQTDLILKEISFIGLKYMANLRNDAWELEGSSNTIDNHPLVFNKQKTVPTKEIVDLTGTEDHFMIIPQTISEDTEIFRIVTEELGEEKIYSYTLPNSLQFEEGKSYRFRLNIGYGMLEIEDVVITPWDETNEMEKNLEWDNGDIPVLQANATLDDVIKVADKLYGKAQSHPEYSSNPELLIVQYGRINRYNSSTWDVAGGKIPEAVKTELDNNEAFRAFSEVQTISLPNGETWDAPHFWAALNGMMKNNGDLCGWGGDLVEFAADVKSNSSISFPSLSFNAEDWRSDADAYNIYISHTSGTILDAIGAYAKASLTENYRITKFLEGGSDITARFNSSPNKLLLNILMSQKGVNATDVANAAEKMQLYIDDNR